MGEAKRRKQSDPNYGKPTVAISTSKLTGNYLVLHNGKAFDSTCKLPDAEKCAEWLRKEIAISPLPPNWDKDLSRLQEWVNSCTCPPPKSEAVAFELDRTSGEFKRIIIDV